MGLITFSCFTACAPSLPLQSLQSVSNTISQSLVPAGEGKGSSVEIASGKREFAVSSQVAFAAAMSIAQDAGFRLQSADLSTGLITGVGSSSRRINLGLAGLSETFRSPILSIQIESISTQKTKVRLMLAKGTSANAGSIGEQAVRDPAAYQQLFSMLNDEIIRRTNLSAELNSAPKDVSLNQVTAPSASPLLHASDLPRAKSNGSVSEIDIPAPTMQLEGEFAETDELDELTQEISKHGQTTEQP